MRNGFRGSWNIKARGYRRAILANGFSGADFAQWIKDRRINTLQEVRQLPPVLKDRNAKAVFLKDGMKMAVKTLDRADGSVELQKATLAQLASALQRKANETSLAEVRAFREDDGATLRHVEAAIDALRFLQAEIAGDF